MTDFAIINQEYDHLIIIPSPTGQDVLHAGVATHYCESATIPEIEKALLELKNTKDVDSVMNDFCPKPKSEFVLAKHLDQINTTFNAPTVEGILSNLEKDGSEWAQNTIKVYLNTFLFQNCSNNSLFFSIADPSNCFTHQLESDTPSTGSWSEFFAGRMFADGVSIGGAMR